MPENIPIAMSNDYTIRAARVLQLALRRSLKRGTQVQVHDLLQAMLAEGQSSAVQALANLGHDPKRLIHAIERELGFIVQDYKPVTE